MIFKRKHFGAVAILLVGAALAACDGTTVQVGLEGGIPRATTAPPGGEAADPTGTAVPAEPTTNPGPTATATPDQSGGGTSPTQPAATSAPAVTSDPAGAPAFEAPGADWVTVSSAQYGVTLQIPPGWQRDAGYDERYSGPDGHILLNALGGTGQATAMELCQVEANHELMPFGSAPEVQPVAGGIGSGANGCLVIPSADAMADSNHMALLRYPQPRTIGMGIYPFFGLYGTGGHIRAIASSVQFTPGTVAPTPTPAPQGTGGTGTPARITSFEVTPQAAVARGGTVQAVWQAEGDIAVLCQNFFRPTVTGEPVSTCQDVPVSGGLAVTMPQDANTFFVEFELLVSDTQRTFSEIQMVQLACAETWFFTGGPAECPVHQPFTMQAVAQRFERGWMIAVENMLGSPLDNLYVLFDVDGGPSRASAEPYVLFQNPAQASAPDTIQAPAGLLVPDTRFFSVWDTAGIAQAGPNGDEGLGWAVAEPVAYEAAFQWAYHPHEAPYPAYLGGPDGQAFALFQEEGAPPLPDRIVGRWYTAAD